jgi:hypothetical protein
VTEAVNMYAIEDSLYHAIHRGTAVLVWPTIAVNMFAIDQDDVVRDAMFEWVNS